MVKAMAINIATLSVTYLVLLFVVAGLEHCCGWHVSSDRVMLYCIAGFVIDKFSRHEVNKR
jgi:hypothetical protein